MKSDASAEINFLWTRTLRYFQCPMFRMPFLCALLTSTYLEQRNKKFTTFMMHSELSLHNLTIVMVWVRKTCPLLKRFHLEVFLFNCWNNTSLKKGEGGRKRGKEGGWHWRRKGRNSNHCRHTVRSERSTRNISVLCFSWRCIKVSLNTSGNTIQWEWP